MAAAVVRAEVYDYAALPAEDEWFHWADYRIYWPDDTKVVCFSGNPALASWLPSLAAAIRWQGLVSDGQEGELYECGLLEPKHPG